MARTNTQVANGKLLCGYRFEKQVMRGRNEETGQWEYETLTIDPNDPDTFKVCGRSKKAHGASVKNPITSHPYGGEDGTLIDRVLPKCGACGKTIEKGEKYRFWAPRTGRQTRCMTCPSPSRSSMTGSEIYAAAWDIADAPITAEDQSDLESQRDELADRIGEIVDMIDEKLSAIEDGLGHSDVPVYYDLEERKGMYEDWQQTMEQVDFSAYEEANEDECSECGLDQESHGEDADPKPDHEFEASFDLDGAIEELENAIGECPE